MQLLGTKHIHTTNGLVERLHHLLKASLKAQPDPTNWTDLLPMVLLGIRTAVKEDIHCTAAELVYGTTLRLPSQFFSASSSDIDPTSYVQRLKSTMQQLHAPPVRPHHRTVHILNTLQTASLHVHMSSSDMMPSASHCNIPIRAHTRYLSAHQSTSPKTLKAAPLRSPWIISSPHPLNHLSLQLQLHHHSTYSLALSQAQPPQHLHHELVALDDTFAGLIAFITESWPSLWWGSICGVQYSQTRNVVLYNGFSVWYFGFYVKSHRVYLSCLEALINRAFGLQLKCYRS